MNYGVFGGSFDPPHISHVLACLWGLESGEVDRILVIPCANHPLGKEPMASFEDRLAMCRLAMTRIAQWVEILDMESRRSGASYTIDTLRRLQQERPGHSWRLLIGFDILQQTQQWKDWSEVVHLAPPLVVPRLTGDSSPHDPESPDLRRLSSTSIRNELRLGNSIPTGLLPASVLEYIQKHGLYRVG